jgi:phosphoribosylcarboxyaminoimidazole (NCAIR) mutase
MRENFTNSTNLAAAKNREIRVLVAGAGGAMAAPIVVALD